MTKKIFMTGATGSMGIQVLDQLLLNPEFEIRILVQPTPNDLKIAARYADQARVEAYTGDLRNYEDVLRGVDGADFVLHLGAIVSPLADYHPDLTMRVNYGSTLHILRAIREQPDPQQVKLVFISSVVVFGDRMPPIHWGRTGDPVKPSVHDYYGVSKVASERAIIESGLSHWDILRLSGILSSKNAKVEDGIIFHNCLDNALEYVSDRDAGILLRRICENAPDRFWSRVYNVGGGPSCYMSTFNLFRTMLARLGINDPSEVIDAKWFAIRNFHGCLYQDSDLLQEMFDFRHDGMDYFFDIYVKELGLIGRLARILSAFPLTRKLLTRILYNRFRKLAYSEHGTMRFIEQNVMEFIEPQFISKQIWESIPDLKHFVHFQDWDQVIRHDHGYDEKKPEADWNLQDMQDAARFRGGKCLADKMTTGDTAAKLSWQCAFGHQFEASPKLILHAGHWCPVCEDKSWNFHEIAKVNPFFAQVWYPLHSADELSREYPKRVRPADIERELAAEEGSDELEKVIS